MRLNKSMNSLINFIKAKGLHARVIPLDGFESFDLTVGSDLLFIRVIEGIITQLDYNLDDYEEEYIKDSAIYILKNCIVFGK